MKRRGVTLHDVADNTNVAYSSVVGYFHGQTQPSVGYAKSIADYLKVPVGHLVCEGEPHKYKPVKRHTAKWVELSNRDLREDA